MIVFAIITRVVIIGFLMLLFLIVISFLNTAENVSGISVFRLSGHCLELRCILNRLENRILSCILTLHSLYTATILNARVRYILFSIQFIQIVPCFIWVNLRHFFKMIFTMTFFKKKSHTWVLNQFFKLIK